MSGCSSDATPQTTAPAARVSVAAALEREITEWDEFTGRLEAVAAVQIRPRVSGYIDSVAFSAGSNVRKGELLFVIDPRPYQAELDKAAADLARAQARAEWAASEVARSERLRSIKAISEEEYDQKSNAAREATASVAAARAAVESAQLNLSFTRVTSPIAGRVGKAEVTAGNLVSGGSGNATLLTSVVCLDPIYVSFEGDEQAYLKYRDAVRRDAQANPTTTAVRIGLANESDYPHAGHMVFIDNQIDPRTGTIRARASLDNKEGIFTPGLFARVQLQQRERHKAVLVDDRAVGTDQSQKFIYVIDSHNTVSYRKVTLGRLAEGLRIVVTGLAPDERVVVNGLQRVHPGSVVTPQFVAMDTRRSVDTQLARNLER
jgi:RND family efflux transporter MFP subunit